MRRHFSLLKTTMVALPVLAAFLFSQCAKEHVELPTVYFQEDIFPIVVTSCTQSDCHNPIDLADGYDLTSYEKIMEIVEPGDYKKSKLYTELVKPIGYMPEDADRLSDDQITKIARWIEAGAENNSNGGSTCDTSSVTYSGTVRPLVEIWCYSCHTGNFPVSVVPLGTYADVKLSVDDGRFLGSIRHDSGFLAMPDGGAKLPDCDIQKIAKWVADGALNN